jgi:hypothetical protein
VKYCLTLKQKDMPKNTPLASKQATHKPATHKQATQKPAATQHKSSNNPYICLDSDSEEEVQNVSNPIDSFPQLCVPANPQHQGNTYAAALASKPIPKTLKKTESVANSAPKLAPWVSAPSVAASPVSVPVPPPVIRRNPRKCWADDSDSEDEEEQQAAPLTTPKDFKVAVPVVDEDW